MVGQKLPYMVIKWPFISGCWPQVISEAVTFEPIKIYTNYSPQIDQISLSFVKDEYTFGKKMARNGCKMAILWVSFISKRSIRHYRTVLHFFPRKLLKSKTLIILQQYFVIWFLNSREFKTSLALLWFHHSSLVKVCATPPLMICIIF